MPPKKTKAERAAATAAARAAATAAREAKKRKASEVEGKEGGEGDGGQDNVPPPGPEPEPEPETPVKKKKKKPAKAAPSEKGKGKATEAEEEEEGEAEPQPLREEPCDRCVRSALNGVSLGDCRVGSATKCARCKKGKTPCYPLSRAALPFARRFLASKAVEGTPRKDLARLSATLRSLLGEEEEARKRLKVEGSGEAARESVPPVGTVPLGSDHGTTVNPPVVGSGVGRAASSSASAVRSSVSQRLAIDSLVGTIAPEPIALALSRLLDDYAAALRAGL
ncbi:uncharacterized protein CTRU02_210119 [Colletotrichum truncatum]|uniref:Uncharacterized protein n=1 Tax=Colletotrichum truncatum TaxID=5467 RepID=A0ACC3YUC3_COLTU